MASVSGGAKKQAFLEKKELGKALKKQIQELNQVCDAKRDGFFIENSQDVIADVMYTFLVLQAPQGISNIQALIKHMQTDLIEHIFKGDK